MPKATFYTHVAQPAAFACRLIARAIRDGGQILVWSDSAAAVQQLDIDLWQQIPEALFRMKSGCLPTPCRLKRLYCLRLETHYRIFRKIARF